jgi:hypothetical protein
LIIKTSYSLENSGLRTKISDVSMLANREDMEFLRNEIADDLRYYKREMKKYIELNLSAYPLYLNDTDDRVASMDRNYKSFSISSVHKGDDYEDDDYMIINGKYVKT